MHQLGLIGGRHEHHTRQATEVGTVEYAGMGRPIGTHQPRPVHGEAHRQPLNCDIVDHLVIAAL